MAMFANTEDRSFRVSVSKRNRRNLALLDDYALEFNSDKSNTFFRILQEYNTYRCLSEATR